MSIEEAIARRRSIRTYSEGKIGENDISQLLWAAQGITNEAAGLRTAPSAGALYPWKYTWQQQWLKGLKQDYINTILQVTV